MNDSIKYSQYSFKAAARLHPCFLYNTAEIIKCKSLRTNEKKKICPNWYATKKIIYLFIHTTQDHSIHFYFIASYTIGPLSFWWFFFSFHRNLQRTKFASNMNSTRARAHNNKSNIPVRHTHSHTAWTPNYKKCRI